MALKIKIASRIPKVKRENLLSKARKSDSFHSKNSPLDHILFLQRTIGNQAVERLFRSGVIQTKLKIGQPNNSFEQEGEVHARVDCDVKPLPADGWKWSLRKDFRTVGH